MLGNDNAEELLGAYHSMDAETATRYVTIGQMLAEQFPKLATIELVHNTPSPELEVLKQIGELAPAGMCIVRWADRVITWSNNAYKRYFVDLEKRDVNVGVRIDEVLPEFSASGLEEIFRTVAETGVPFTASNFSIGLPNAGMTYWDWSLSALPFTQGMGNKLLIQMQRVPAAALSLAA
jgi:hypothetical protein